MLVGVYYLFPFLCLRNIEIKTKKKKLKWVFLMSTAEVLLSTMFVRNKNYTHKIYIFGNILPGFFLIFEVHLCHIYFVCIERERDSTTFFCFFFSSICNVWSGFNVSFCVFFYNTFFLKRDFIVLKCQQVYIVCQISYWQC